MDVGREIRKAAETGKVVFGTEKSMKAVKNGEARLLIVAENVPQSVREDIEYYSQLSDLTIHSYEGSAVELGTLCGKPFIISVIAVISFGESNLLAMEGR